MRVAEITSYVATKINKKDVYKRQGLNNEVDITKYADKKYDAAQMKSIRLALEEGMDITPFADNRYNCLLYTSAYTGMDCIQEIVMARKMMIPTGIRMEAARILTVSSEIPSTTVYRELL